MNSLYRITKTLKGDTGPNQNQPLKDEDGKLITAEKDKTKDGRNISNMFSMVRIHPSLQTLWRQRMTLRSTSMK